MIRKATRTGNKADTAPTTRLAIHGPLRLAAVLDRYRREDAYEPARVVAAMDGGDESDRPASLRWVLPELVDYLTLYFRTRDESYKYLLTDELIGRLDAAPGNDGTLTREEAETDVRAFATSFGQDLGPDGNRLLEYELSDVVRNLTTGCRRTLDVLMFSDCLARDVIKFLRPLCREDGIAIRPTYVFSKNPAEQRNMLRGLADRKFDVVFYSPFTHGFSPEYSRLSRTKEAFASRKTIHRAVDDTLADVAVSLDLLLGLFDSSVVVHNSANFRRHDGTPRELIKNLVTLRTRHLARQQANAGVAEFVAARHAAGCHQLSLLDEEALRRIHGDNALGQLLYDSGQDEPIYTIGRWVAARYREHLHVRAYLAGKKLVVCDLDNTLWDGLIGEGAVQQHVDRQRILRRLRERGILLAVCSKNDAKKVHWEGAVLREDDFACMEINWNPKTQNLFRIQNVLNLKAKDFVFIDDRPDERELVASCIPDLHVMDATSDRVWRQLDLWSRLLPCEGELDRTQLYQQRARRQAFLDDPKISREDEGKALAQLGIRVSVQDAREADLPRVVELINRTNQFNLCGSRTTPREAEAWLRSGDHRVLVAEAGDKFGTFGMISVAVARVRPDRVEIPVFVLSCRAFGYGLERVVINTVKRLALATGGVPLAGLYRETGHNEPCRKTYPDNGFQWNGGEWFYTGEGEVMDPPWLEVHHDVRGLTA